MKIESVGCTRWLLWTFAYPRSMLKLHIFVCYAEIQSLSERKFNKLKAQIHILDVVESNTNRLIVVEISITRGGKLNWSIECCGIKRNGNRRSINIELFAVKLAENTSRKHISTRKKFWRMKFHMRGYFLKIFICYQIHETSEVNWWFLRLQKVVYSHWQIISSMKILS